MSTQNPLDSEIIKLIVAMFNAAPGADVLAELRNALEAGESVEGLARNLVRTEVFRSLYPDTLSSAQFAAQFAHNVLGNEVESAQLTYATLELNALQLAGLDRGQVVLRAIEALLTVEPTNPEWGDARKAFENKLEVAEYYSIEKEKSAQSLEELQNVLAPVTSSEASTESAIRVIEGLPPLPDSNTPTPVPPVTDPSPAPTPTPTPTPTPVLSISGLSSASVNENSLYSATASATAASGLVTWTLEGPDAGQFVIDAVTGALSMAARNFEAPADADSNNVYQVTVRATDASAATATQSLSITVTDVIETSALTLSGLADATVNENSSFNSAGSVAGAIGTVSWSLEGPDAEQFTIDPASGALNLPARNFEAPADAGADNVYNISVRATDADNNTAVQAVAVTIADVIEISTLTISGLADTSVSENTAFTATPSVAGAIGAVSWSLDEGDDAGLFSIDATTGAVSMIARNFEAPVDAGADNVYNITVRATDADSNTATQAVAVTIADVVEVSTLTISGLADVSVNENTAFSTTASVAGAIGTVTWQLEGADSTLFTIDAATGALAMVARDFEAPADAGADNVYNVTVRATDADGNTAAQDVAVTIADVVETATLELTVNMDNVVDENIAFSTTASVAGAIGVVTWSLEGADAGLFSIDASTGALSMVARDFEAPADAGANNVYEVSVRATDADGNTAVRALQVEVANVNEASTLSIAGLADAAIAENNVFSSPTPTLSGAIGTVTWSLEGADAGQFSIDAATGALSMVARDFETPADADADNVYAVTVRASDSNGNTATQALSISVTDIDDAPTLVITGLTSGPVDENTAYSATPAVTGAVGAVTWALEGSDAALFSIDAATGALSLPAMDFEAPADSGVDNLYSVAVRVTDSEGNTVVQPLSISIADVIETSALSISGLADWDVDENSDSSSETPNVSGAIGSVTWSVEGADAAQFGIDAATGVLSLAGRNFELPADAGTDNVYNVIVRATDADGNTATQDVEVTVRDIVETATLTISGLANASINENAPYTSTAAVSGAIGAVTWSLEGADAAQFGIDAATGVLSMAGRNFELPADAGTDNVYNVTVRATDADGNTATQAVAVTVDDVVEASTLTITGLADIGVNENAAYSATAAVTGAIGAVTWTLESADAALFSIDAATGTLSMVARDFEDPVDAGADNVYNVTVRATDADDNTATQAVAVTIADALEASTLTISGLSDASVSENASFGASAGVAGAIGAVTWTLEGADASLFSIDAATGALSMAARNFELPADAGADNVYNVTVRATDADSNTATQAVAVTIADVLETSTLIISGLADATIDENTAFNATGAIAGAIGAVTWTLEGADASLFSIDAATGALSMVARDFEAPVDAGADNVYNVTVRATDADSNTVTQTVAVTITDAAETVLSITGPTTDNVNENAAYTATLAASNATGEVTWSKVGGEDAALFTLSSTGELTLSARDAENPQDHDLNNTYRVEVSATDALGLSANHLLALTVDNVEDVTTAVTFDSPAFSVNEDATLSFTGAQLFEAANFTDDTGVTLASLALSGRSGTLTVNGSTIGATATATVTAASTITWRPTGNVNGSAVQMFNARATASDGSTSDIVAVNADVAPVPDASTLTLIKLADYDLNPGNARNQSLFVGNSFDADGSMTLTLNISAGYSAADGDTLSIDPGISPSTAVLFSTSWDAGTGSMTIVAAEGQVPNSFGWTALFPYIQFSTNDLDIGDSRTFLATLVSGPEPETRTASVEVPFVNSSAGEALGELFSVMAGSETPAEEAEGTDQVAPADYSTSPESQDPLQYWHMAETYALQG